MYKIFGQLDSLDYLELLDFLDSRKNPSHLYFM